MLICRDGWGEYELCLKAKADFWRLPNQGRAHTELIKRVASMTQRIQWHILPRRGWGAEEKAESKGKEGREGKRRQRREIAAGKVAGGGGWESKEQDREGERRRTSVLA